MKNNSFCFVVFTFNHEKYIVEHLESIKYQIKEYGCDYDIQLIVSDDASVDKTTSLINDWLSINSGLFHKVDLIFNKINIGTCKSVCNCLRELNSDYCKLTAGDDVYSCESIFELALGSEECDIISGVPVRLVGDELFVDKIEYFNTIAINDLYKKNAVFEIVKSINFINAPNVIYNSKYLKKKEMIDFLSNYDVVEDWPIQIFISNISKKATLKIINKCFVYYRRTEGSTYIVASKRVRSDVNSIYDYLLTASHNFFSSFLLRNRRFCYELESVFFKKVLNVSLYIYTLKVIFSFKSIIKRYKVKELALKKYKHHHQVIKNMSELLQSNEGGFR